MFPSQWVVSPYGLRPNTRIGPYRAQKEPCPDDYNAVISSL